MNWVGVGITSEESPNFGNQYIPQTEGKKNRGEAEAVGLNMVLGFQ